MSGPPPGLRPLVPRQRLRSRLGKPVRRRRIVRVPRVHLPPGLKLRDPGPQTRDLLSLYATMSTKLLVRRWSGSRHADRPPDQSPQDHASVNVQELLQHTCQPHSCQSCYPPAAQSVGSCRWSGARWPGHECATGVGAVSQATPIDRLERFDGWITKSAIVVDACPDRRRSSKRSICRSGFRGGAETGGRDSWQRFA